MKRAIHFPKKRRYRQRPVPLWLKYAPGYGLLVFCLLFSFYKDALHFDNGSGGVDWEIGKPKVTVWTASQSRSLPELRAFALRLINRDRQLNGRPSLVEDPLLTQAAQRHAEDMKTRNYYDHLTPEGRTATDRLAAIGGQGGVGENIMLQSGSIGTASTLSWGLVENFQKSWMYSDGHRANLLKLEYTKVGYGIVADPMSGKIYAVQNFQ